MTLVAILTAYAVAVTLVGAVYAVAYGAEREKRTRAEMRALVAIEAAGVVRAELLTADRLAIDLARRNNDLKSRLRWRGGAS